MWFELLTGCLLLFSTSEKKCLFFSFILLKLRILYSSWGFVFLYSSLRLTKSHTRKLKSVFVLKDHEVFSLPFSGILLLLFLFYAGCLPAIYIKLVCLSFVLYQQNICFYFNKLSGFICSRQVS